MILTASNIVRSILGLPRNRWYEYVNPRSRSQVKVLSADGPEGPLRVERRDPGSNTVTTVSLSSQMIWRVANACKPNTPINLDRVLGASYNTRSLLEALMVHTPEFYWCTPGRIELVNDSAKIRAGHKHLLWSPAVPHENGVMSESESGSLQAISEIPSQTVTYEALTGIGSVAATPLEIEVNRRHLQIQIALIEIGVKLGFRTWIAQNDRGYLYGKKRIGELEGVIPTLANERVLSAYEEAQDAARLIDCIWFKNGRLMPAVIEVEHSTGVTSGLTRMKKFQDLGPSLSDIRWVIVAADEDRNEVIRKASTQQFASLNTKFFPYSAVEELHSLSTRRGLSNRSVNEAFLDCFMESCVANTSNDHA
jgi:type II restriction enzyme